MKKLYSEPLMLLNAYAIEEAIGNDLTSLTDNLVDDMAPDA